eukprot:2780675-Pleurochrysis_carterae.AAC.1
MHEIYVNQFCNGNINVRGRGSQGIIRHHNVRMYRSLSARFVCCKSNGKRDYFGKCSPKAYQSAGHKTYMKQSMPFQIIRNAP